MLNIDGVTFNHSFRDKPQLLSGLCYYVIGYYDNKLYRNGELLIDNIDKVEKVTENRFVIGIRNKGKVIIDDYYKNRIFLNHI